MAGSIPVLYRPVYSGYWQRDLTEAPLQQSVGREQELPPILQLVGGPGVESYQALRSSSARRIGGGFLLCRSVTRHLDRCQPRWAHWPRAIHSAGFDFSDFD